MEEGKEKKGRKGGRMRGKGRLHAQVSTSEVPRVCTENLTQLSTGLFSSSK